MMLSASVCGLGCASIGKKIDQAIAPVFSGQPPTPGKTATSTDAASAAAAKADYSSNAAAAHEKFNAMLQENGVSK